MIDYNVYVAPFEAEGLEPSQIAELLSAATNGQIDVGELENLLSEEALARRNPITGSWEGSLVDKMQEGNEIGEGLEELFSHLNKPRSVTIATNERVWGEKCYAIVRSLVASSNISEEQADRVYALAGGRVFGDVSEQDVLDSKAAFESQQSEDIRIKDILSFVESLQASTINPAIDDGQTTVDQLKEAIKAEL